VLQAYPLRANAATAAVVGAVGDFAAQVCEWKLGIMSPEKEGYNFGRTFRMCLFGGLFNGPLLCLWYKTLHSVTSIYRVSYEPLFSSRAGSMFLQWAAERSRLVQSIANLRVKESNDNSAFRTLAIKVVTDSLLAGPICLHVYFAGIGVLEGLSAADISAKTQASFHRAWGLSVIMWLPLQIINFKYVPLHFQAAFVSFFNAGWRMTLSIIDHYHDYHNTSVSGVVLENRLREMNEIVAMQEAEIVRLRLAVETLHAENTDLRDEILARSGRVDVADVPDDSSILASMSSETRLSAKAPRANPGKEDAVREHEAPCEKATLREETAVETDPTVCKDTAHNTTYQCHHEYPNGHDRN